MSPSRDSRILPSTEDTFSTSITDSPAIAWAVACFLVAPTALLIAFFARHVSWVVDLMAVLFWVSGAVGVTLLVTHAAQYLLRRRHRRRACRTNRTDFSTDG